MVGFVCEIFPVLGRVTWAAVGWLSGRDVFTSMLTMLRSMASPEEIMRSLHLGHSIEIRSASQVLNFLGLVPSIALGIVMQSEVQELLLLMMSMDSTRWPLKYSVTLTISIDSCMDLQQVDDGAQNSCPFLVFSL